MTLWWLSAPGVLILAIVGMFRWVDRLSSRLEALAERVARLEGRDDRSSSAPKP